MSDTIESLRKKISNATDLGSVVRTMKALAASSLGHYERSVRALDDYYENVELSICACLSQKENTFNLIPAKEAAVADLLVFGSDQGLVGRFNEAIIEYTLKWIKEYKKPVKVRIVGERLENGFNEAGVKIEKCFGVANSPEAVTPLIGSILKDMESESLFIFYNRPSPKIIFEPVFQHVLPLLETCGPEMARKRWPTKNPPEVLGDISATFHGSVREYLFVSLYRGCIHSLAAENASRLASMQRAEKNIDEILDELGLVYNRIRQGGIDEELFDVIAGFEALKKNK